MVYLLFVTNRPDIKGISKKNVNNSFLTQVIEDLKKKKRCSVGADTQKPEGTSWEYDVWWRT